MLQNDATIGVGGGYPHLVIVQQELVVQVEVDVGNCEWTVLGRVLLKEVQGLHIDINEFLCLGVV